MLAAALTAPAATFTENFESSATDIPDGWDIGSAGWAVKNGAFCQRWGGDMTLAEIKRAGAAEEIVVEATVVVQQRKSAGWAIAAVLLRQDDANYWHLALVEAPPENGSRRFVELSEKFAGVWNAQFEPATRVKSFAAEGVNVHWELNRPYRLRLKLGGGKIEGVVAELDGTVRSRIGYELQENSVKWGAPALASACAASVFDDVRVEVAKPYALPPPKTFPKYDAAGGDEYRGKVTGFFHTEASGGRDWLVDPNGRAFYWVGTDHVSYRGHWCEKLGYAPYARVAEKKYGTEEKWADAQIERLKSWGFNTLATGYSDSLKHRGLAHIVFLSFGSSFAPVDNIVEKTTWTGFPNVFSPDWPRHCEVLARRKCAPLKDDPWLIGYFLDNELEWYGKKWSPRGIFEETWKKPAEHTAKQALVEFVRKECGSIAKFNEQFGTSFASFEQFAADTQPRDPKLDGGDATARGFIRLVAEKYFKACNDAMKKADPNHLNLGTRFAGQAPADIWDIAGKHCDIVSLNSYPRIDVERGIPASYAKQMDEWHAKAGKPMAITEWSFPALDAGLPSRHGAGMRVDTQSQRAACFSFYQDYLFRTPYIVGSSFFMFLDEPALGISSTFPEDSNYGLINEQDEPYKEITETAVRLNREAVKRHREGNFKPAAVAEIGAPKWARDAKEISGTPPAQLAYATDKLTLEFREGGSKWTMKFEGKLVAELFPLAHFHDDLRHFWLHPVAAKIIALRANATANAADIEFTYRSDQPNDPRTATARVRYWIPKDGGGWIASQALRIENTGTQTWRLGDFFHYMTPKTDGSPAQIVSLNEIPSYYRTLCAWADKQRGLTLGAWYAPGGNLRGEFWKDCDTCFHSDVHEKVDVELAPGATWKPSDELAFFFVTPATTREAHTATCDRIAAENGIR